MRHFFYYNAPLIEVRFASFGLVRKMFENAKAIMLENNRNLGKKPFPIFV